MHNTTQKMGIRGKRACGNIFSSHQSVADKIYFAVFKKKNILNQILIDLGNCCEHDETLQKKNGSIFGLNGFHVFQSSVDAKD